MKAIFLTKYDRLAANTRYRCLQYVPFLQASGVNCTISPLLDDNLLKYKFRRGYYPLLSIIAAYFRRFKVIFQLKNYDILVLHYELFPYFPALFEKILNWLKVPYIYDFDDAIFQQYEEHPNRIIRFLLKSKIRSVIRGSSAVFAGNPYLAQYAAKVASNVEIVPTVVDPIRYASEPPTPEKKGEEDRPFTIGWIGSPSTVIYVMLRAQALRRFFLKYPAQLVLIGSGPVDMPGIPLVVKEWSEETELEELKKLDVGIMPLTDDTWSRGKCGFKLIQYMASSLPVIASPVGVNCELVEDGKSGYLASEDDEWVNALETLYHDRNKRIEMGKMGRRAVIERYSVSRYAPVVNQILWRSLSSSKQQEIKENIDVKVAENFGEEWEAFPQTRILTEQLEAIFQEYFSIFPFEKLSKESSVGIDVGCGSGRWAHFIAPKVKKLICSDASERALKVAESNLRPHPNVDYVQASVGSLPFESNTLDFAYSVGVLHHVPRPHTATREIARVLKPGAPFLIYVYYAFDNRGSAYKFLWRISDFLRVIISRQPFRIKYAISQLLAAIVYWPLARFAKVLSWFGILTDSWTLAYYRDKSFYVMRTDALDRFGTRLEQRFTRPQVRKMLEENGFEKVIFSSRAPYWVAVAYKKQASSSN